MTAAQLIRRLQMLPPDTLVWIDISSDYEDHATVSQLVRGHGSYGMGGGDFKPDPEGKDIELR